MSKEVNTGTCRFCRQMMKIQIQGMATQDHLDQMATDKCTCEDAKAARIRKQSKDYADGEEKKMYEEKMPGVANLLLNAIDMVYTEKINDATVNVDDITKIKISVTSKGKIKVEKTIKTVEVHIG